MEVKEIVYGGLILPEHGIYMLKKFLEIGAVVSKLDEDIFF